MRHFWLKHHACSFWLYQGEFWTNPGGCISKAYEKTDQDILKSSNLGLGGSTAVTAILINGQRLWVANVGDSRAVLSRGGQAIQMTIDHEPSTERGTIENKGGFVSNLPGFLFSLILTLRKSKMDIIFPFYVNMNLIPNFRIIVLLLFIFLPD